MHTQTKSEAHQHIELLLPQAINKDPQALDELFSRYRGHLYSTAFRLTGNSDDAEDALQDGLLSAYRNLTKFEGRSRFSTWLTRIVINAALMQLRRSRNCMMISIDQQLDEQYDTLENRISDSAPNPEEAYRRQEYLQIIRQALQSLRPIYRDCLWLCDFQGMSYREASARIGVPMGSLKAQLYRARRMLWRKVLGPRPRAGIQRTSFSDATYRST